MSARVAWISIAPVKGLALAQRSEVLLDRLGVRENRRFHLVDADGRLQNGKQLGALVRIASDYSEEQGTLALRFPDGTVVAGEIALGESVTTSFYGRPVEGRIVLGPWAEALSDALGRPLRLVRPEHPGDGVDRGGGPVSLLSTSSLEALRLVAGSDRPIDPRRFRMLFGVDGIGPHDEDTWLGRSVRIGEATVVPRGNVGRCAVTTHHPETGEPDLDTLGLLAGYRGDVETTERLPFGVWGEVAEPGLVRVGDPVEP